MIPIEVGSQEWRALVDRARKLDSSTTARNWSLGDMALQIAPIGDQANNGAEAKLRQFADELENVEYQTLRSYRLTAHKWPLDTRVSSVSHRVHAVLQSREDRFSLIRAGMTKKLALEAVGNSATDRRGQPAPTQLGIINEIVEIKRRIRSLFQATIALDPSDDQKQLILSDFADVEQAAEEYRLLLLGEGIDQTLAKIMEEV